MPSLAYYRVNMADDSDRNRSEFSQKNFSTTVGISTLELDRRTPILVNRPTERLKTNCTFDSDNFARRKIFSTAVETFHP